MSHLVSKYFKDGYYEWVDYAGQVRGCWGQGGGGVFGVWWPHVRVNYWFGATKLWPLAALEGWLLVRGN